MMVQRCSTCSQTGKSCRLPPNLELAQVTGFSLYLMKAVMNGRGEAVIDLAQTNLFR